MLRGFAAMGLCGYMATWSRGYAATWVRGWLLGFAGTWLQNVSFRSFLLCLHSEKFLMFYRHSRQPLIPGTPFGALYRLRLVSQRQTIALLVCLGDAGRRDAGYAG